MAARKTLAKAEKLLAQCDGCNSLKVRFPGDKHDRWHHSIATFTHLPIEKCYGCKQAVEKPGDMGITENNG